LPLSVVSTDEVLIVGCSLSFMHAFGASVIRKLNIKKIYEKSSLGVDDDDE
jgi:hypothetical protein